MKNLLTFLGFTFLSLGFLVNFGYFVPKAKANDIFMPNPASIYCEDNGGSIEVREDFNGNQVGVCVFEDGSECRQWDFYRGECQQGDYYPSLPNPASVYCEDNGGYLDIRTDDMVYGDKGVDFLNINTRVDNIITNPPYKLALEFCEHALKCADKKVAMLLKLVFLEGISRYEFFKTSPLKKVYVFCKRQPIRAKTYKGDNSSMIAYAWFVWEKDYDGEPTLDWIP